MSNSRQFLEAPEYLAALSNRPVTQIAAADLRRRLQIGLDFISLPQRVGPDFADVVPQDPFRRAFIRINEEHNFYLQLPNAVTMLTPSLFRAAIPLPAAAPIGTYNVDVKLLARGALVVRATSAFEVIKVGFEQFIAEAAHQYGFAYGIATACMALLTGWIASVVFRRD